MRKSGRISFYAMINKGLSVLIGPITVFFISKNLTAEEIAFYYTFFNLIGLQQLAELGIGHTIKQYVSHSLVYDDGVLTTESKQKINSYLRFSKKWFGYLSLFVLFVVGCAGQVYYDGYQGIIEWQKPWWCLVIVSFFNIRFLPYQIFSEACQQQILVFSAQIIASLAAALSLWISLLNGFGLFSIAISYLLSTICVNFFVLFKQQEFLKELSNYKETEFVTIFKEVWPLLKNVSVVWGVGFLFWNGINLISFKVFDKNFAGLVIFTFTIAKMIFSIAETIVASQMTVWSNMIANNEFDSVVSIFKKYRLASLVVYLFSFSMLLIAKRYFGDLWFLAKLLEPEQLIQFGVFFFILLYLTTANNLIRCLKIEPFMYVSIFHGLLVPALFYLSVNAGLKHFLIPSCLVVIVSIFASKKISKNLILGH